MSDFDLIEAVARKTGEDSYEIRRRGFMLTEPEVSGTDLDPECIFDLIDLPESGHGGLGRGAFGAFFPRAVLYEHAQGPA